MYTVSIPLKQLKEINLLNSKATCSWFTPEHCSFSEKEREGMDKEDEMVLVSHKKNEWFLFPPASTPQPKRHIDLFVHFRTGQETH